MHGAGARIIHQITLAITNGIGLGAVAGTIHPYPTRTEAIKQVADMYNRTRLTPLAKKILGTWLRISR